MGRLILLLAIVAGVVLVVDNRSTVPSDLSDSDGASMSASEATSGDASSCTEPENPYDEGSGHYAGYEWAESSGAGSCGGNSDSFIEGCEEYQSQEDAYEECEAK